MSNLLPKYYVTFGVMYSEEEHPYFPNAHPDGWVEIESPSENEARIEAYNLFNDKWAFIYNENNFDPTKYPAGRIATVKEIKDFDTENLLYYKVKSDSSNTIVIVSETEHKNTLSPDKMMVMNNVSQLFSQLSTFPRTDKFEKRIDNCMETILHGLPRDGNEIQYTINLKEKILDLIKAI